MFLRSILYPSLVAFVIGAPMLYSSSNWNQQTENPYRQAGYQAPVSDGFSKNRSFNNRSFNQTQRLNSRPVSSQPSPLGTVAGVNVVAPTAPAPIQLNPAAAAASIQIPQFANVPPQGSNTAQLITPTALPLPLPTTTTLPTGTVVSSPIISGSTLTPATLPGFTPAAGLPGFTPDYGAAETFVFPGDANGPDLTAQPTDFIPVTNLAEIIRFDVYPNWVKNRWKRVSTNPGDAGLHGLRVAVVTGTNTWDLHGSLTYYFDVNQRAQRITFRGWTGDSSRLVNLLTSQFGLKAQPTHWAGAYAAQNNRGVPTAGLLMQHPAVITRENPVQQVAMVMELNHPQGSFQLSPSFLNMLRYAVSGQ